MKPHSIRRTLYTANVALGLAALALAAVVFLKVKPAAAKVLAQDPGRLDPKYEALIKDYDQERRQGLKWAPKPPVSEEEMRAVILRADYKKKNHWVFSGPLPPPDVVETPTEAAAPPPPKGLDALGSATWVIYNGVDPSGHLLHFVFGGSEAKDFSPGEFVKKDEGDPDRFKFTGLARAEPGQDLFEVLYEVYEGDQKVGEGKAICDSRIIPPQQDFLRRIGPGGVPGPAPTGVATTEGTPGPSPDGPASGGAAPETPAAGEAPATTVIEPVSEKPPAEGWRLEDLQPVWHQDPGNTSRKAVAFDRRTYDYFRGKSADSVAASVKTSVATDPATGRTMGLRITGFGGEAPTQVFDVRRGDILVSVDGHPVTSREDVLSYVKGLKQEKLVTVVINRNGRLLTYIVDPSDPHTRRSVRYFENLK